MKIVIITPDGESSARNIFKLFWSGYHSPEHSFIFLKKIIFQKIEKFCNLKIKSFMKIFDPFSNIISIKNILLLFLKMKNQKIVTFTCFKIFQYYKQKNRLFFIMEKK